MEDLLENGGLTCKVLKNEGLTCKVLKNEGLHEKYVEIRTYFNCLKMMDLL